MNRKLRELLNLLYVYNTENSQEVAETSHETVKN